MNTKKFQCSRRESEKKLIFDDRIGFGAFDSINQWKVLRPPGIAFA
jgi:hypothetical protein